jgi:heptosyltransferase I
MAVAVGTPVVGLYAVAPSWLSGPYLQREYVIDHHDDAVREILNKDPETVEWGTRVHDVRAMQLITVDEVLERLSAVLEGQVA